MKTFSPFTKKMLILICLLVFTYSMNGTLFAQNPKFEMAGAFGSKASDEPRFATTDAGGNYYSVGYGAGDIAFTGTISLTGRGGSDGFIVKYDNNMNLLWARYVGGTGSDGMEGVTVNSAGDVIAVGKICGLATIDGTAQTIAPTNSQDGCIVIYDKDGNFKAAKKIAGKGSVICYSVVVDKSDNILVTGATTGETDFGNDKKVTPNNGTNSGLFIAKFDKDLLCQWAVSGDCNGNASAEGWTMNLDKDENILVAGRFGKVINIVGTDNNTVTNTPVDGTSVSSDGFISKFTKDGVCQWIKTVTNGSSRIDMKGIASDSQGNVVVSGLSNAAVTAEGNSGAYPFTGNFDGFLVKYSSTGEYVNGFSLGGPGRDEVKSVFVDNKDNIYISGNMNGAATTGTTVNFNPKGATPVNKTCYGHDGYFAKYNGTTLELIQVEKTTTPSKAAEHEVAFNVTMSKDYSRIYVLGYFNNAATVFDGETGTLTLPNVGPYDIYWITYTSDFIIKTKDLPAGVEGEMYYASINVDNANGAVSYAITKGALPDGLVMNNQGSISGISTKAGTYNFTVTIQDQSSSASRDFTINVSSGSGCDIRILSDGCPNAHMNRAYSFQFQTAGDGDITYSLAGGTLPAGLTLSGSGLLSGTPASTNSPGIYSFTVKAAKSATCFDEIQINMILDNQIGTDISSIECMDSYLLYPVPADDQLSLKASFKQAVNAKIEIVTPTMISVWSKSFKQTISIDEVISVADLPAGIYYVILNTDKGRAVKSIVVI